LTIYDRSRQVYVPQVSATAAATAAEKCQIAVASAATAAAEYLLVFGCRCLPQIAAAVMIRFGLNVERTLQLN
jgi:hypothetical protein